MTFGSTSRTYFVLVFTFLLIVSVSVHQTSATPEDNQTVPLSKFVPKSPVNNQTFPSPQFVPRPGENTGPINDQFSMTVQFQPSPIGLGVYQVSDWQLSLSNPNRWCASPNCAYQLTLGYLRPGDRGGGHFFGLVKTISGDTTRTSNLEADWTAVEERILGSQIVQVIEGTLTLKTYVASFRTDNQYRISGTLAPYGQGLILTINGVRQ